MRQSSSGSNEWKTSRFALAPGIYGRKTYDTILRSISNANPIVGIKPSDNAAFGVRPQGYGRETGMANRLAGGPMAADLASLVSQPCLKTLSVWRYRGRWPLLRGSAHAIVVTSPHN